MASKKRAVARRGEGKVLSAEQYDRLLGDVANIIERSRKRAEQAAANVLVGAYYQVGKRIEREKATRKAGYGDHLLDLLSADLGIDKRTLERACKFSQLCPAPPKRLVGVSHWPPAAPDTPQ